MSVPEELDRFVRDGRAHAAAYGEDYQRLWTALGEATDAGKRLRSALLLAAYRAYGGTDDELAARVGAAVELLHTAFVVHDDVIDRDLVRRGVPNVAGVFADLARDRGASADGGVVLGRAAGVLAGDLALVGAVSGLAGCGADAATTRLLLDQVTEATRVSAAGELDDVALGVGARPAATLGEVLDTGERKTAVYSFQLPLRLGATLAGAPVAVVEHLGTVGRLAGIGFQLVDDLRGVFAAEAATGKSSLGDLREGKVTALVVHARGTDAWPALTGYLGDPGLTPAGAAAARDLLEACGSRAFVEELADSYLTAALHLGEEAGLEPGLLTALTDLCHRIRESVAA